MQAFSRVTLVADQVEQGGAQAEQYPGEDDQYDDFDPHRFALALYEGHEYINRHFGLQWMRVGRVDFRPALIPSLVFLALLGLLVSLGLWQVDRAEQKQQLAKDRETGAAREVLDLNWHPEMAMADRFRPAVVKGRFEATHQWLQDNQIHEGQAGYHVYSLFVPAGGAAEVLLVNRGWVPVGRDRAVLPDLPVPDGEVVLHGRLDKPASVGIAMGDLSFRDDLALSVHPFMDVDALSVVLQRRLFPLTLVLDEREAGALTKDWSPALPIGPEKHLGYALQWFSLALALVIIFVGVNVKRITK